MASTLPSPGTGSPAYTSYMPCRPSIRAPPLATSRSTQPSTVGNLATSTLGATAGVAAGGRNRAGDFLRRNRRRSDGHRNSRRRGAKSIHGFAELGEFGGRLGLRLLDLVEAVAGLVELAHGELGAMFDAGLQRQDVGVDPSNGGLEGAVAGRRCVVADKMLDTRGRQRAAKRACHRCQRHYGRHRGKPALAEHSLTLSGFRLGTSALTFPGAVAG